MKISEQGLKAMISEQFEESEQTFVLGHSFHFLGEKFEQFFVQFIQEICKRASVSPSVQNFENIEYRSYGPEVAIGVARQIIGEELGEGDFKFVWDLGNEMVLKIAKDEEATSGLLEEADVDLQEEFGGKLIPKVFYKDPYGIFIVAQKANTFEQDPRKVFDFIPLLKNEKFQEWVKKEFRPTGELKPRVLYSTFMKLVKSLQPFENLGKRSEDEIRKEESEKLYQLFDWIEKSAKTKQFVQDMIKFVQFGQSTIFGISLQDVKLSNMGWLVDSRGEGKNGGVRCHF